MQSESSAWHFATTVYLKDTTTTPKSSLFSYTTSAASPSCLVDLQTEQLSSDNSYFSILVLLLDQPVFPQLQVCLTLERFQVVRTGVMGGGISPMLKNQPSFSYKNELRITHHEERESKGRRRFFWFYCWTRSHRSGFSSSPDLGLSGCCLRFYPFCTDRFHWFGYDMNSSISAPTLPSNTALPPPEPLCHPAYLNHDKMEKKKMFGAESVCQNFVCEMGSAGLSLTGVVRSLILP